jgi:signal transduction histidine kinase
LQKQILILFLITKSLFSEDIFFLEDNFEKKTTAGFTEFIKDENKIFAPHQILEFQNLQKTENITFIGIERGLYWSRTTFQNVSKSKKEVILYNILPEMDFINIYVFKDGNLVKSFETGELGNERKTRLSQIKLNFEVGEKLTVVASYENFFLYEIGWTVIGFEDFLNQENWKLMAFGFFIGTGVVLSIASFLMFFVFKDITYIFPFVDLCCNIVHHYGFHGLSHQIANLVNLKIVSLVTWISPIFVLIADIIYVYFLFNLKDKFPRFIRVILLITYFILFSAIHITYIYYYGSDEVIIFTGHFSTLSVAISRILILLFGVYLYVREGGLEKVYFIIAQAFVTVAFAIMAFAFNGFLEFVENSEYVFPVMSQFFIIFILLAQYTKTKNSVTELKQKKEFLLRQSHFSAIGQTIGYVSHQWKSPMTSIGSSISLLETIYIHKKDKFGEYFEKQLPKIKKSLSFMKGTIDEFTNYFSPNLNDDNLLNLSKTLENILNILDAKIVLKNINFSIDINENVKIPKSYEHIFSNIFIVLINNSVDEFKKEETNRIQISVLKNSEQIQIDYLDNAGGIKTTPPEKIFEYFVSSKKSGQGLGLPITKMLVEDRLNGQISVRNRDGGANFIIQARIF